MTATIYSHGKNSTNVGTVNDSGYVTWDIDVLDLSVYHSNDRARGRLYVKTIIDGIDCSDFIPSVMS